MAIAHVQSTSENSFEAGTTHTLQLTGVTAGSLLVAITRTSAGGAGEVSGVSDDLNGAYTLLDGGIENGSIDVKVWYKENAAAGTTVITVTSAAGNSIRWAVLEYSGVATSSPVDVSGEGSFTTTTNPVTSSVTLATAGDLVISTIGTNSPATTIVPASGETERQEVVDRFQVQDEIVAGTGGYTASWTLGTTQPGVWAIAAFKAGATQSNAPRAMYRMMMARNNR